MQVAGRPIHVWSRPASQGLPLLVAFHGLTDGGIVFGPMAESLVDHCVFAAPDAPGHGLSRQRVPRPYDPQRLRPLDLAVLDRLRGELGTDRPVVLLGHSMGAVEVAELAADRPDVVRHVVLEEPPGPARLRGAAFNWMQWIFLQRLRFVDRARREEKSCHVGDWSPAELEVWGRSKLETRSRLLLWLKDWDAPMTDLLSRSSCPVTVLLGAGGEGQMSQEHVDAIAALGPRLRIQRFDGAGHNPRREAPEAYRQTLLDILSDLS